MKIAKYLSLLGFILMSVSILIGFIYGDFSIEGSEILSLMWGKITLIDIYLMFFIFGGWIYYQEDSSLSFLIWFILLMVFGSATAYLYLYLNFKRSNGNWQRFFVGKS